MTVIRGVLIVESPCCKKKYATPRFLSMNFMASEYWTDGYRHNCLTPNDVGLRRCICGNYLMLGSLKRIEELEKAGNFPSLSHVDGDSLIECIESTKNKSVEAAARRKYWQILNHSYRDVFRKHQEIEEANTKLKWELDNPDERTLLEKLRRKKRPVYQRSSDAPFTYPIFEATEQQLTNLEALYVILKSRRRKGDAELAELLREQSRFREASDEISLIRYEEDDQMLSLIKKLIEKSEAAPMPVFF